MYAAKRKIRTLFFATEILIFCVWYYASARGLRAVTLLRKENKLLEQEINELQQEIDELESKTTVWKSDPFYKEKVAREKLHMIKEGEELYIV